MLNIRESTWIFITEPTERLGITVWRKEITFLSFQSPCISSPCQNNGTCAAHYEKNSYVCLCAKGYTGKYCETGKVLAFCNEKQYQIWIESIRSRVINVTQTKPDKCSRKKIINQADLVYFLYSPLQAVIRPSNLCAIRKLKALHFSTGTDLCDAGYLGYTREDPWLT